MPYKFSPSSLGLLKECPRCFWLNFNKGIKRPRGIFPSLPSGMDYALKDYFDSFRGTDDLPPPIGELEGVRFYDNAENMKIWRNNLKGIQWVDEDGNLIRGAIDDMLVKGDKLIVLDYKTRGFPLKDNTADHYQDQLDIYNFLLRKNGFKTEDYAYLLFYFTNRTTTRSGMPLFETRLVRRQVSITNAELIIKKAVEVLSGGLSDPSETCEYCAYVSNRDQMTI